MKRFGSLTLVAAFAAFTATVAIADDHDAPIVRSSVSVKVYDGVGYSVTRASAYAEAGIAALGRFPDSPARQILTLIAEYVIHRDR